jgi:hypothetical protein
MSGILIKGKDEIISISAPDIYGADFKISILEQASGTWIITDQDMSEYQDVYTENNQTISADATKGDTSVLCSDASGFSVNDVVIIKNFYYRVNSVNDNTIMLHSPLREDLVIDDICNLSGNTSLYYVTVNLSNIGNYLIRAKSELFGLDIRDSIKVEPKSMKDMYKDIKNLELAILGN